MLIVRSSFQLSSFAFYFPHFIWTNWTVFLSANNRCHVSVSVWCLCHIPASVMTACQTAEEDLVTASIKIWNALARVRLKEVKAEYSSLWESISELRGVTCHMGSHSVTCHPTQVNAPRLNPSQPGRYSIYLPRGIEGWVDLDSLIAARLGIEATTA